MPMIEPARLQWRDDQPFALDYDDIYYASDGPAEVRRVFLEPSGFSDLAVQADTLLVGELGFGTGLNFAVMAEDCIARGQRLHFVSFELRPLQLADMQRIASQRAPEFPIYRDLVASYPALLPGWHRRSFADGLITLSVFWGEAAQGLSQLVTQQRRPFSFWLLDGFAPDRNPELWQPALMQQLAQVSHRGAGVATFTAAGRVRRALQAAGFEMRRVDQRPHKRESLAGRLNVEGLSAFTLPERATVIGAGIAGASAARHLADQGIAVHVVDQAGIASGASRIPATVMHGRLQANVETSGLLRAHAYLYARDFCRRFAGTGTASPLRATSALQVCSDSVPVARLEAIAELFAGSGDWLELLDASAASELAGVTISDPVLQFADAWLVDTPALCAALLEHPNIEVEQVQLSRWPETPAIAACGLATRELPGAEYLELAGVSGQLDVFRAESAAMPRVALVGNGYLAPLADGFAVGASYEYQPWPEADATSNNQRILQRLTGVAEAALSWQARSRGERSVSSDRLPIAGELIDQNGVTLTGRYVSTGHGSMGTVSSHYAAAELVSRITGDFSPLGDGAELLSPARFRVRQARRGYRFAARN